MRFTVYPAIDIVNGKCVRLYQGDYGKEKIYGDDPLDQALQFAQEGAQWILSLIHISEPTRPY